MEMEMRQGRADKSGREGWKVEPKPKAVHESAAADLGMAVQYEKKDLYGGQGFKGPAPDRPALGPGGGRTIHHSGSQGKHK
jgi:hypothetical protein